MKRLTQAILTAFIIQFIVWVEFFYVFNEESIGWWMLFIAQFPAMIWASLRMPCGLSPELSTQIRQQVFIECFAIGFVIYTIIVYFALWIRDRRKLKLP